MNCVAAGAIPGMMRAFGEVDRDIQFGGETLESGDVVGVLMRDQDGGDVFGALAEFAEALEGLPAGKAGIDQDSR